MEMADSESSDDAFGKSSKQSTDNTRRLKKKLKELQWKLFVSETGKHCVDAQNNSVTPAIGLHEGSGEDDGPLNTAKLRSPTGLASRGSRIHIGEHPDEIQGEITL